MNVLKSAQDWSAPVSPAIIKTPNMHSDTKAYTHWLFVFYQDAGVDAL